MKRRVAAGVIVVYRDPRDDRAVHDVATCEAVARRLSTFTGRPFAGHYDSTRMAGENLYFVPMDTVVGTASARSLGIHGERDLFGGVVPYAFVATKSISHALVDERARAPRGWSNAFSRRVHDAVLPGYAAFSVDDAGRAGIAMLREGPVRIKRALGIGGRGQAVVHDRDELERVLADTDPREIERHGISLELHLEQVTTYSIGRVQVDDLIASYCGTQRVTRNNAGHSVYGGSALFVVRGDFDALFAYDAQPAVRRAIEQARCYDSAATACFDDFFASRRNYDVAEGVDDRGRRRSGVLEQSWRIGGASGAEVEALAAFRADPALGAIHATTTEVYGEKRSVPANATVYFDGNDPRAGPLLKYVTLEAHVHA